MTRKQNSQKRKPPHRESAPLILVLCGGRVTEPEYFNALKREYRKPSIRVEVKEKARDPVSLIEYAEKIRSTKEYDEIWCVVDVDEFDLGAACAKAQESKVHLAISNPCFEYWLLLHFEQCATPMKSYDQVMRKLRKHLPHYDKKSLKFTDYAAGIESAIAHAQSRCPTNLLAHKINPSSNVWALVEVIT